MYYVQRDFIRQKKTFINDIQVKIQLGYAAILKDDL